MIDIHTHILPNIDDGSKSIEETFNLIKEAKSVGFDSIVLTSHYMEGYYETNSPEREVWLDAIRENLEAKNIDTKTKNKKAKIFFTLSTPNIFSL